jgi:hypothetical protein
MENINTTTEAQGETTDVTEWLSRYGLHFEDLGDNPISTIIRQQWRAYQAVVHKYCVATGNPPERVRLTGVYAKLRVPLVSVVKDFRNSGWDARHVERPEIFN